MWFNFPVQFHFLLCWFIHSPNKHILNALMCQVLFQASGNKTKVSVLMSLHCNSAVDSKISHKCVCKYVVSACRWSKTGMGTGHSRGEGPICNFKLGDQGFPKAFISTRSVSVLILCCIMAPDDNYQDNLKHTHTQRKCKFLCAFILRNLLNTQLSRLNCSGFTFIVH